MDIYTLNQHLAAGVVDLPGQFPRLDQLKQAAFTFRIDFGLARLPTEGGILLIRGARQYGKSTWLESEIKKTIEQYGPGSAFYLNGEYLTDVDQLEHAITDLLSSFSVKATVKRLFIDEITAIARWEVALKRLADSGQLRDVLVVTTGSKMTDIRRASERLPGRKGRLDRTTYLFTPIAYTEFKRVCGSMLGDNTLLAYLLSGGSPIACSELASNHTIPEYVIELTRDWIEGEMTALGRSRVSLLNIMNTLFRYGGTPVGQAKLAREAGLANNTVAASYIELLNDLGCVLPAYPWDESRKLLILRKPCKYHFTNLLAATAYHPARIRSIYDFQQLPEQEQGIWYEWLVSQELLRRAALAGTELLSPQGFWQSKEHEIDFVVDDNLIEVKRGKCSSLEFAWFARIFPKQFLTIINANLFETKSVRGVSLEDFLEKYRERS